MEFWDTTGRKWGDRATQLQTYAARQEKGKMTSRAQLWAQRVEPWAQRQRPAELNVYRAKHQATEEYSQAFKPIELALLDFKLAWDSFILFSFSL